MMQCDMDMMLDIGTLSFNFGIPLGLQRLVGLWAAAFVSRF